MIGWVLFSEKDLMLRFTMSTAGVVEKTPYSLGGAITDFTAVSPQISEKLFSILGKKFVTDVSGRIDTPTMGAYVPFLRKALESNPYLFIYLKFYAECLILSCNNRDAIKDVLEDFLCSEIAEEFLPTMLLTNDAEETASWLGKVICKDMEFRRSRTKHQIEDIVSPDSNLAKYTPAQRLYIIKCESGSGLNRNFNMQMASEYDFERSANLGTVKASLIDNASGILAEFEINNPDDLLALELFHTVKGDLPIKKCRCCGEYFVPSGRSDSEYCSRISLGENKRCAQIGAMRTFKGKYAENPIYAEYNRAYKRNHSRLRNGKLYDEEFRDWSAAARKARDEFIAENKTVEQFKLRLTELEIE